MWFCHNKVISKITYFYVIVKRLLFNWMKSGRVIHISFVAKYFSMTSTCNLDDNTPPRTCVFIFYRPTTRHIQNMFECSCTNSNVSTYRWKSFKKGNTPCTLSSEWSSSLVFLDVLSEEQNLRNFKTNKTNFQIFHY